MEYPGIADMPRENDRTSQRKFTDVYPVQGLSVSLVQGDWLLSPPPPGGRALKDGLDGNDIRKERNCPGRTTGIGTDPCTMG